MDSESRATSQRVEEAVAEDGRPALRPSESEQGVYARMRRKGYRFGFFQAARLLDRLFPDAPSPGETARYREERVRFRPYEALTFPASDLRRIEWLDEAGAQLVVTMLGLYGVDSPLPDVFHEKLAVKPEETRPYRDFLDIFNHRLYAYYFRAWKKHRPGLHHRSGGRDAHSTRFIAAAGLGTAADAEDQPVPKIRLAALAGRWSMRPHNAEGLRAILENVFDEIPVDIVENVPRWVPIPSRATLGAGGRAAHLGQDATIGEAVRDRTGKFRVRLGPLGLDDYLDFLPGGDGASVLRRIVRAYAPDFLDFDVELQVRSSEIPETQLGDSAARLGLTTCLGTVEGAVLTRTVEYDE